MPASQPLSRILSAPDNELQPLLDHARRLQQLSQLLRQGIDQPLADHISLSNVRGDTAVIATDSPAWLSKIRYLAPELLRILRAAPGLATLQHIQFKVIPAAAAHPAPLPPHRPTLSRQGADILRSTASGIEDPQLSAALRRLAQRASKQTSS